MAWLIKNHWGLLYPGIITNFFFELEVWSLNSGPAISNLKLRTGYSFPSYLQKLLLVYFGAVAVADLENFGGGGMIKYMSTNCV